MSIAIPEPNFIQICAASEWLDPASRRAFLLETATVLTGVEIAEGVVARARARCGGCHPTKRSLELHCAGTRLARRA
jgi:hypothetical protein